MQTIISWLQRYTAPGGAGGQTVERMVARYGVDSVHAIAFVRVECGSSLPDAQEHLLQCIFGL